MKREAKQRTNHVLQVWFIIISAVLFFSCNSFAQQAKLLPPDGKILLFIGQDRESIDAYSRELNTVPAGVMFYTSIQTLSGIDEPADHGAGFQDGPHLLKEYPDSALQIGFYMVDGLENTLNGKYDENIKRFGQWLKEIRRPVYLRIGYEFDLPQNKYSSELYKKVFRYLVDHWRQQGVSNVAYVWHSYGVLNPEKPVLLWYPGDDYVDWFAVSFFNFYNRGDLRIFAGLAREHGKPLMIAEASTTKGVPSDSPLRWKRWYKAMFDYAQDNHVQGISYINCDWEKFPMWKGQSWGDSRVQTDPLIKIAWLKEISNPKYLRPSSQLFKQLGVKPD